MLILAANGLFPKCGYMYNWMNQNNVYVRKVWPYLHSNDWIMFNITSGQSLGANCPVRSEKTKCFAKCVLVDLLYVADEKLTKKKKVLNKVCPCGFTWPQPWPKCRWNWKKKPLLLSRLVPDSGWGASAHRDRLPPFQRAAADKQRRGRMRGQRGLPLILDPELEVGGDPQYLGGVPQPPGRGRRRRPLQLDQHLEPPGRPVEQSRIGELRGHPRRAEPRHANPAGPGTMLAVELEPEPEPQAWNHVLATLKHCEIKVSEYHHQSA